MTARNQSRRTYAWTIPTSKTHNARTVWILNILVPFHRQSRADNGHSPSGRLCGTAKVVCGEGGIAHEKYRVILNGSADAD